jgi:hypothetical protein
MKKIVFPSIALLVVFSYFVNAKSANAFWLTDLFGGGRVKGEQTTTNNSNGKRPNFVQKIMTNLKNGGKNATKSGSLKPQGGQSGPIDPAVRVDKLIKAGKLTAAQGAELLAKLKAIIAKKEELKTLQKDLATWLKDNKVESEVEEAEVEGN